MSGGAGHVFSREMLKRFAQKPCTYTSGTEDVEVGKCMQSLGKLNNIDGEVRKCQIYFW